MKKTVWLWVIFFLVYGLFSMKTHAAGFVTADGRSAVQVKA